MSDKALLLAMLHGLKDCGGHGVKAQPPKIPVDYRPMGPCVGCQACAKIVATFLANAYYTTPFGVLAEIRDNKWE